MPESASAAVGGYAFDELFLRREEADRHICLNQESGALVVINDSAAAILRTLRGGGTATGAAAADLPALLAGLERRRVLRRRAAP